MDSPGIPPETSNFYCLPGKAGGFPIVLIPKRLAHHSNQKTSPSPKPDLFACPVEMYLPGRADWTRPDIGLGRLDRRYPIRLDLQQ